MQLIQKRGRTFKFRKAVTFLVLCVYFISHFGVDARSLELANSNVVSSAGRNYLSAEIGRVTEKFVGDKNQEIFVIQDLHCDENVQKNIEKIIKNLKENYGKELKVIGIEGSPNIELKSTKIDEINNKKVRMKVVENLIKEGYLTGAEKYILEDKGMKLYGIENEEEWKENFRELVEGLKKSKGTMQEIQEIRREIEKSKKNFYKDEMKNHERMRGNYKKGKLSFEKYVNFLLNEGKKRGIGLEKKYENLIGLKKVRELSQKLNLELIKYEAREFEKNIKKYLKNVEIRELENIKDKGEKYYEILKMLSENNNIIVGRSYYNLNIYFDYLERSKNIDEIKMLDEKHDLEKELCEKYMFDYGDGNKIVDLSRGLELYEKYVNNMINRREGEKWLYERKSFYEILSEIGEKILYRNKFDKYRKKMREIEEKMNGFYETAEKRNESLVNNLVKLGNGKKVMIVGGYHAEGISNILKSRGISYQMILPNVMKSDVRVSRKKYLMRVKEQAKSLLGEELNANEVGLENLQLMSLYYDGTLDERVYRESLEVMRQMRIKTEGLGVGEGELSAKSMKERIEYGARKLRDFEVSAIDFKRRIMGVEESEYARRKGEDDVERMLRAEERIV